MLAWYKRTLKKHLFFLILVGVFIIVMLITPNVVLAYSAPDYCNDCHDQHVRDFSPSSIDGYESYHDKSTYISNYSFVVACQTSGCHQITSPNTGQPNLWVQHIGRSTATYPSGMDCSGCHHGYSGSKLDVLKLAYAIYQWENDCDICHEKTGDHELFHDTSYVSNKPVDCTKCHSAVNSKTGNAHLWTLHINKSTTSYPGGMNCNSCHSYSGSKLSKATIDNAIDVSNTTKCDSCHSSTMHSLDPNADHRTNFLGDNSCSICHVSARAPAKDNQPNLQDLHMTKETTSYPDGMDCNSCHNYQGSKLSLINITTAINSGINGNTRCDACHTVPSNMHEDFHNTKYQEGSLLLDCEDCHEMKSPTTLPVNTANLWEWHIGRRTTSYKSGMNCASCHSYQGSKLSDNQIDAAVTQDNTYCDGCHKVHYKQEASHDTTYGLNIVSCSTCHSMVSDETGRPNLQKGHLGKRTTTYSKMSCTSCHDYSGKKLRKRLINKAIVNGNTNCATCHADTIHSMDGNTKHKTTFLGSPEDCNICHEPSREAKSSEDNLQDLHLEKQTTSYPGGMNCNSCHDYRGRKLEKDNADKAIEQGNTKCNACHELEDKPHISKHDTDYLDNSPVDCSSCHQMVSVDTGKANLWAWHLDRETTSYAKGMNCKSCHDYQGLKLQVEAISEAISSSNTNCDACHSSTMHALDPNTSHRTSFLGKPNQCIFCHPFARKKKDTVYNLQDLHLKKATTSYSQGMDCNSCHVYKGKKLSKSMIDKAIAKGGYRGKPNTNCDGCHLEVGPHDWFKSKASGKELTRQASKHIEKGGILKFLRKNAKVIVAAATILLSAIGLLVLAFKQQLALVFSKITKFIHLLFS